MGGIGSVILGWILWRLTGNIVLAAVLSVIAWPLLTALLEAIITPIKMIGAKKSTFYTIKEIDYTDTSVKSLGMRVLILTGEEITKVDDPERLVIYEKLYTDGVANFFGNENFKKRILLVEENKLPLRVCIAISDMAHQPTLEKCLNDWGSIMRTEAFQPEKNDIDIFIEDFEYTLTEDGEKQKAGIVFCFDKNMVISENAVKAEEKIPVYPVFNNGINPLITK